MISLFKSKKDLQKEWKTKTITYAKAINTFVAKGIAEGWDQAGPEPKENISENLLPHLLNAIKEANAKGELEKLRIDWPLAHAPLIPILEKKGQSICPVCLLDDGTIVARIGTSYEDGCVVEIRDRIVKKVNEFKFFGRSPNREYFAYTTAEGVKITEGWKGSQVALCLYPTGLEDMPDGFIANGFDDPPNPTQLIPFPDGKRVLFVSAEGIFVLSETSAKRLLPTFEAMKNHFEWLKEKYPDDELSLDLSMEHGAVSQDGNWIAIGSQDSKHLVFDSNLNLVAQVGHLSEYPHYALFSSTSDMIAFNSCHFYNGITIGVPTSLLPGLETEAYESDERLPVLDEMARVYAGVYRNDEYIIGDASGYLRAFDKEGNARWHHFLGSSVGDIDVSKDGKTLVCSTYAGFLSILKLDTGYSEDYEIGNGGHTETRRWLFWKGEPRPYIW